jgi:hypothetical protein
MTIPSVILAVTTLILFGLCLFFIRDKFKKLYLIRSFLLNSDHPDITFDYKGAEACGRRPGMYNIAIRWNQPFSALVGLNLTIPLFGKIFYYFGYTTSLQSVENGINGEHIAIISTYFGRGPCRFRFFVSRDVLSPHITSETLPVATSDDERDQGYVAFRNSTFPPSFIQKLGFFN